MVNDRAQQVLAALDAAMEEHPALEELLRFYQEIYQKQFALQAALPPATCSLDEVEAHRRLEGGQHLLEFADLGLTLESFAEAVEAIGEVMRRHNPEWAGVCDMFPVEQLLEDARQRFHDRGVLCGGRSVCSMVVTLALTPFLQHSAQAYRPLLDDALWRRGSCPICGSWPQFSFLDREAGARHLHCPCCDTLWSFDRVACPFCGKTDTMLYYASEDQVYRLYACQECKTYLKTVDLRRTTRNPDLLVERLVTISMDLAAQEQGYSLPHDDGVAEAQLM